MYTSINKQILFENFHGRSTPLQKNMIEEWLRIPGNEELFYEWLDEWERRNLQFIADDESGFKKITESQIKVPATVARTKKNFIYFLIHSRVAATILFIFVFASILFLNKDALLNKTIRTGFGEVRMLVLPDGSSVNLNSNSTLQFSRFQFGSHCREVLLSGEADFSIIHTPNNEKFLVKTSNNLSVLVLGTQFTVYARSQESKVVLKKGKVELNFEENKRAKKLIMSPGDLFTVTNKGIKNLKHVSNPENMSAWKNHEYLFESTSLIEVAKILKYSFGVEVSFQNTSISESKISGSLKADNSKELINTIADLLGIQYTINENTVYFFE